MSLIPQPQRGPAGPAGPGGGGLPLSGVLALGNQSGTNDIEMGIVGTQKAEITNASIIESERIDLVTGASVPTIASTNDITLSPTGVVKILNATPTLLFDDTTTSVDVVYNPTGSQFSESALTTSAHEIGVYTGVVGENIAMGMNQALQVGYISGQGLPLFIGESGQNSYSGLFLGNGNSPTNALFIDRKDDTDVTQTACNIVLTGAGIISIESQLATGGIGINTTASADININSGQGFSANAVGNMTLTADNNISIQANQDLGLKTFNSGNMSIDSAGNLNLISVGILDLTSDNGITLLANSTNIGINSGNMLVLQATDGVDITAINDMNITAGDGLIITGQEGVSISATNADLNLSSGVGINANAVGIMSLTAGNNVLIQATEDIDITTLTASTANISLNSANNITLNSVNNLDLISANGITLTTTNSTSVGITTDADLIFTGAGIESNTAGANSTQFLRIKLNGTFYKILLKFD